MLEKGEEYGRPKKWISYSQDERQQGGLCEKVGDLLVVKDSVLRGSPIFSQRVAKRHP